MNQNLEIIKKLNLKISKMPQRDGELTAFCPFHSDEHPSLGINVITGKFLCRAGCIRGHSIRDLVFKLTGETIKENNEINWAENFKRKLSYRSIDDNVVLPAIPVLPLAINNAGEGYLKRRGFIKDSIINWDLQYWEQEKAIVIPIYKVGYILRYLSGEKKYKYVTGTEISKTLFGINKLDIEISNLIILVEGALDTIWMHQLGYKNTLGILGSNLSDTQYKLLQGLCKQIVLLFDSDSGGDKASKSIGKVLRKDFIVKTCKLPKNKDPNDCEKSEIENNLNTVVRL